MGSRRTERPASLLRPRSLSRTVHGGRLAVKPLGSQPRILGSNPGRRASLQRHLTERQLHQVPTSNRRVGSRAGTIFYHGSARPWQLAASR